MHRSFTQPQLCREFEVDLTVKNKFCVFSPPIRGEDGCFLYGVFNGYDGSRVASFASQRLTAELLLGQINSSHTDGDIRRILTQVIPDSVLLLSWI